MRRSVVIVGGGPAGLSAARVLVAAGLRDVLVLERNPAAGGVPRFCGHRGWGMLDFGRFWTGPGYAARLVQSASGAEIRTNASVLALHPGGELDVSTPAGIERVAAREAGATGAFVMAGVAAGVLGDLAEATAALVATDARFDPDPAAAALADARFARFRAFYAALGPVNRGFAAG